MKILTKERLFEFLNGPISPPQTTICSSQLYTQLQVMCFNINNFPWNSLLPGFNSIVEYKDGYTFVIEDTANNSYFQFAINKNYAQSIAPAALMKVVKDSYDCASFGSFSGWVPEDDDEDTLVISECDDEPEFPAFAKKILEDDPKHNDGRPLCFWCGEKTEKRGSMGEYDVCPHCKK